jgi:cytochrome c oxidase cbb3-type subunit 3
MWFRLSSTLVTALAALSFSSSGCGRSSGSPALPSATPSAHGAAPSASAPSVNAPLAEGARVFERYCQLCHAKDATGYAADNAPSLVSKTFLESATDEQIAAGIRLGRPGTAMAAYGKVRGGPLE